MIRSLCINAVSLLGMLDVCAAENNQSTTPAWLSPSAGMLWESSPPSQRDIQPYLQEVMQSGASSEDKTEAEEEEEPGHIRDNAFLVEEAFNQEAGEVQHVFNWIELWGRNGLGRSRDFAATYTMEIPLGSQAHQFSFTTQFLDQFEQLNGNAPTQQGGVGDTFLNYRYQLLANDDFLWCAPRGSLLIPTGDERFGLGPGQLGYQYNLPISRYGDKFDFHFNAGYTYIPNVSAITPALQVVKHELHGINVGGSVFWKPKVNLNFFVETLALQFHEIDVIGERENITQVYVNPGARYAVCQFEEVEWVLGLSVPVGLTSETPDIGLFMYMSVEHAFNKQ